MIKMERFILNYVEEIDIEGLTFKQTNKEFASMYLNITEKCIYYNEDIIKEESNLYDIDLDNYIEVILAHEIGHFLDKELIDKHEIKAKLISDVEEDCFDKGVPELLNQIRELNYAAEIRAWDIAGKLIRKELIETFNKIQTMSLEDSLAIGKDEMELELIGIEIKRLTKPSLNS